MAKAFIKKRKKTERKREREREKGKQFACAVCLKRTTNGDAAVDTNFTTLGVIAKRVSFVRFLYIKSIDVLLAQTTRFSKFAYLFFSPEAISFVGEKLVRSARH